MHTCTYTHAPTTHTAGLLPHPLWSFRFRLQPQFLEASSGWFSALTSCKKLFLPNKVHTLLPLLSSAIQPLITHSLAELLTITYVCPWLPNQAFGSQLPVAWVISSKTIRS